MHGDAFWLAAVFAAGMVGGGINAVAGGGTFFSFPVFLAAGIPPVVANASNTLALWPGSFLAAIGYREELKAERAGLPRRLAVALAGGIAGALLLLALGNAVFMAAIPVLLLFATGLFAAKRRLAPRVARALAGKTRRAGAGLFAWEFLVATYGGYFGAGLGVLLMAGLSLTGIPDAQRANAVKNFLSVAINGVAVLVFVASGAIHWPAALTGLAGAMVGGYFGARAARRLPVQWLERIVVSVGLLLTVWYGLRLL
jgi:uncharacterized membrane protein YfcA